MAPPEKNDVEAAKPPAAAHLPYWKLVVDQAGITPEVASHQYEGSGTASDPYRVHWLPHNDPRDPMRFSPARKWTITISVALATLAVALVSSAYTGGIRQIIADLGASQEVATLGVSLFVLGFAIGPLVWAPLSEVFGRQVLFFGTYAALTAFNAGAAGARDIQTLIVLRFFAGAFGSSPLTNAGGVIADMFPAEQRGLAMSIFAAAPFLGPVLGPIIGGFLGEGAGWRWVLGFLAAFSGFFWILAALLVPETYAPVLLRKRAEALSKMFPGKHYVSKIEFDRGKATLGQSLRTALSRPMVLLLKEPIVLLLSVYMAIVYGTLYMLFGAFPIVFQQYRGWSQGIGGLAFLGITVGMVFALVYNIWDNRRYVRVVRDNNGFAAPEARLPPTIVGAVALPVGLFWFAWTNSPDIHWLASVAAGVPFGFGMVLVFLSIMNYLIDSYTIFAASVLAASSVLRSIFGATFPLFTTYMYQGLGIHWASSIPAFLALACIPFPILFYKYGASIREKCRYAGESADFMRKMQAQEQEQDSCVSSPDDQLVEEQEAKDEADGIESRDAASEHESSATPAEDRRSRTPALSRRTTNASNALRPSVSRYEGNPYDIDRVNTQDSEFSLWERRENARRAGTNV